MNNSSNVQPCRHPAATSTPNSDVEHQFELPGPIDLSKLRENTEGLKESTLLDLIENQQKDVDYQARAIKQSLALEMDFMPPRVPGFALPSKNLAGPGVSRDPASACCVPPSRNIV